MALSDYIKNLEKGVYGEEESDLLALSGGADNIPSEKMDPNFLRMLPDLLSIEKRDEPSRQREIGPVAPPPERQQQQGGGGGLSPLEIWDLYNKYKGEGTSEGASTAGAESLPSSYSYQPSGYGYSGPGGAYPVGSGAGSSAPTGYAYSGPGGAYPAATPAASTAPAAGGASGGAGAGAGGASFGSAGAVAAYIVAASLAQKQKDREEKSKDPGRGPGSRKARILAGLSPSLLEGIKDPKGEGLSQLTGIMPITSFLGMGSKGRGKTESEGTKIWDWLGKLF